MTRTPVVLLPGATVPASRAFPGLIAALGDDVHVVAKELEVFAEVKPPRRYGLNTEVNGVVREAEAAGFDQFHLVGYAEGAACALAFASTYPHRLLSLALIAPVWVGNQGLGAHERGVLTTDDSPGVEAIGDAFLRFDLDVDRLRALGRPVYFAGGGQANPDFLARQADRLGAIFTDFTVEEYDDDAPHEATPELLAEALHRLWAKGETV